MKAHSGNGVDIRLFLSFGGIRSRAPGFSMKKIEYAWVLPWSLSLSLSLSFALCPPLFFLGGRLGSQNGCGFFINMNEYAYVDPWVLVCFLLSLSLSCLSIGLTLSIGCSPEEGLGAEKALLFFMIN